MIIAIQASLLLLLLAAQHQQAEASSLRLAQDGAAALHKDPRLLSQELFFSYEPLTTVTDDAAIDLDQKAMEAHLALGTEPGHQAALKIYREGAFSKSYSVLELAENGGLPADIAKDTVVFGQATDGTQIRGELLQDAKAGDATLQVRYYATPTQATWTNCHVGGNPDPNTDGCFAPTGTIEIGDFGEFQYRYTPLEQTFNERSLQSFSTNALEKMYQCDTGCPYTTYDKFYKYYGAFDYGDQWVMAAFEKNKTKFTNGNADFSSYDYQGTNEAIKKGTAFLNTWMYTIREMEHTAYMCDNCQGDNCLEDKIHPWDKAVSFYIGSQGKPPSAGDGYLMYHEAQKRCENFGTCIPSGPEVGMAKVNSDVLKNFREGKQNILTGDCGAVKRNVKRITELMTMPFVQAVLRYAYIQDKQNDPREKAEAEGASFAAAVLPVLHACDEADALIVYQSMHVGSAGTADYDAVRAALERNYKCMGITCADIGGLVDVVNTGSYMEGAAPCLDGSISGDETQTSATSTSGNSATGSVSSNNNGESSGPNIWLAIGVTLAIAAVIFLVVLLCGKRSQKEYDGPASEEVA